MAKQLINGLAGAIGSRFLPNRNQLLFVEYGGKISVLDLIRPQVAVVAQGSVILKGTWILDCETGVLDSGPAGDIWWEQQTATQRQMTPRNGAQIVRLGPVSWSSVTSATLQTLTYDTTPINGDDDGTNRLTDGTVFAVRTAAGNYAKVQVLDYGYNMSVRYVTYRVASPYRVLGSGYTEPEDIAVSASETTAYVTERGGNLLRVALASASRASATVVASGLAAPHQLHLDEPNGHAYVVEFGAPGRLLRVPLGGGAPAVMATGLERAVGLAITADRHTAYVTEQAASGHRLTRVTLATGAREVVVSGLVDPFFLTWADAGQQRLLVTERAAARRLTAIDLTQMPPLVTRIESGLPTNPSSCAVVAPGRLLVCCDAEISEVAVPAISLSSGAPLLMGIGKVPVDRIVGGRADTTADPAYPYQFREAPWGGTLPVLVNHQRAYDMGARYYRVRMDSTVRFDGYTDYRWNAAASRYQVWVQGPVSVGGSAGFYPVHSPAEQFLYLSPALGLQLDSVGLSDGMHGLQVDFVDASGSAIASSPTAPLALLVNNQRSTATVGLPRYGTSLADPVCGVLRYTRPSALAPPEGAVTMPFAATHPAGFASYSFTLLKGVSSLPVPAGIGGAVPPAPGTLEVTKTVADLLGPCAAPPGVGGFSVHVYVAATMINGEARQSQYDASAAIAFALAPT